jgi:hypothetical protein
MCTAVGKAADGKPVPFDADSQVFVKACCEVLPSRCRTWPPISCGSTGSKRRGEGAGVSIPMRSRRPYWHWPAAPVTTDPPSARVASSSNIDEALVRHARRVWELTGLTTSASGLPCDSQCSSRRCKGLADHLWRLHSSCSGCSASMVASRLGKPCAKGAAPRPPRCRHESDSDR